MPWHLLWQNLSKFGFYRIISEIAVTSLMVIGRVTLTAGWILQEIDSEKEINNMRGTKGVFLGSRSVERMGKKGHGRGRGWLGFLLIWAQTSPWEAMRLMWGFRLAPNWSEGADSLSRWTSHWIQPALWRGSDFGWHGSFLLRQFPSGTEGYHLTIFSALGNQSFTLEVGIWVAQHGTYDKNQARSSLCE